MSNESDSCSMNSNLPVTLLALAATVFIAAQLGSIQTGAKTMKWQSTNLDKQITSLKEAKKSNAELIPKRDELVKQATQVQAQYSSLLNEVLDLAKTDEDAKKVIQKWGIQRQNPPEAGPAVSGAATSKPESKPAK